jgi:hypothetical protein
MYWGTMMKSVEAGSKALEDDQLKMYRKKYTGVLRFETRSRVRSKCTKENVLD